MGFQELVTRAQQGDRTAWTELFERTQSMVAFTALGITGDQEAAQDLAQETYLTALEKLGTLKDANAFPGWLKMICINRSKNYLTAKRPTLLGHDELDATIGQLPEVQENFLPQAYADRQETCRLVAEIVASLPEKQRVTTILYYYDELSVAEIAEMMQVSEGTVKSRLNYARTQIRKQVKDMEKKGVKLYSVAPVLVLVLRQAAEEYTLSPETAARITGALGADAAAGVVTASGATGSSTTSAAGAGVGATGSAALEGISAATAGVVGQLMALPVMAKVGLGLACLALVGGGAAAAITAVTGSHEPHSQVAVEEDAYKGSVDEFLADFNLEVMDLVSLTEDQVEELWGAPAQFSSTSSGRRSLGYDFYGEGGIYVTFDYKDGEEVPYQVYLDCDKLYFYGLADGVDQADEAQMERLGLVSDPVNGVSGLSDGVVYRKDLGDHYLIVEINPMDGQTGLTLAYRWPEDLACMPIDDPDLDAVTLLGMTKVEAFQRFGPTKVDKQEEETELWYKYQGEVLSLELDEEDKVSGVRCTELPLAEDFGLEKGMPEEQGQGLIEDVADSYEISNSGQLIFSVDGIEYIFREEYGLYFLHKAPQVTGPDPEQVRAQYQHAAGYPGREVDRYYADLTHDGVEELIVISLDDGDGIEISYATVYTLRDNTPVEIWQESATDMVTSGARSIYLYREGGKSYLYEHTDQLNQGIVLLRYRVFSLTAEGGQTVRHESETYVEYNASQSARAEFEAATGTFTDKTLLISQDTYQQYSSNVDEPTTGNSTAGQTTQTGKTIQIPQTLYFVDQGGFNFSEEYWPRLSFTTDGICNAVINYGSYVEYAPISYVAGYTAQGTIVLSFSYSRTNGMTESFQLTQQSDGSFVYSSDSSMGYVGSGDCFAAREDEKISVPVQ